MYLNVNLKLKARLKLLKEKIKSMKNDILSLEKENQELKQTILQYRKTLEYFSVLDSQLLERFNQIETFNPEEYPND